MKLYADTGHGFARQGYPPCHARRPRWCGNGCRPNRRMREFCCRTWCGLGVRTDSPGHPAAGRKRISQAHPICGSRVHNPDVASLEHLEHFLKQGRGNGLSVWLAGLRPAGRQANSGGAPRTSRSGVQALLPHFNGLADHDGPAASELPSFQTRPCRRAMKICGWCDEGSRLLAVRPFVMSALVLGSDLPHPVGPSIDRGGAGSAASQESRPRRCLNHRCGI